jgi:hypothetical protein
MQLQGKLERADAFTNLDESKSESQVVCEQCQTSLAFLSYELFSAERPVKGSRCGGTFLDLLRGLRYAEP